MIPEMACGLGWFISLLGVTISQSILWDALTTPCLFTSQCIWTGILFNPSYSFLFVIIQKYFFLKKNDAGTCKNDSLLTAMGV